MQKAIQNALAQQKTENQTLIKKVTELQSQMTQQRKGLPSSLQTEEGLKNYYVSEYFKEIGVLNKAELDADYPQNNNSARINRMEEGLNETRDASNFNRSYFKPITPINFQYTLPASDNEEDSYDVNNNRWTGYDPLLASDTNAISLSESSQPKIYDELLPKLLPAMHDLMISNSFLDGGSEFGGNSKHITKSLDSKSVTATGNFTRIDNGEPEPMLCLGMTWIRKVQGILDPNKTNSE
uniref:Uncharacterized protein n=1 Tax=Rhizophagus irregularis (strain DAOM 181602 / DAOM 197198 / MUCL 43194) TaxID=747089 RepID=U9U1D2_RHIID